MPEFEKPTFDFEYVVQDEIDALVDYRETKPGRDIPEKRPDRVLIATWNIANLGAQDRRDDDYRLIATMIRWFDLIALQEVNDNLSGLRGIQKHLPSSYRALFSDKAGNNERMAFLYDSDKVAIKEKIGEIAIPPSDIPDIKLPSITRKFDGFDRNPYLAAFEVGAFNFVLVNVHLYFGKMDTEAQKKSSIERRSLETYAVARWADLRRKSDNAYLRDIIVLGDFNLPKVEPGDPIFDALTKRGLTIPEHTSRIGSAIASDNHYDQIAFFSGETSNEFTGNMGIFDFDGALFAELWDQGSQTNFNAFMRYYISDHRIMWAEFRA